MLGADENPPTQANVSRWRQAEVQRLPAAHGQAGEGALLAVGIDAVARLDRGDDVVQQVALEDGERRRGGHHVALGAVVLLRPAVRHDDDHRLGLAVGDEVVEQHVRAWRSAAIRFRRRRSRAAGRARDTSCRPCSPEACRRSSCAWCRRSWTCNRSSPACHAGCHRALPRCPRADRDRSACRPGRARSGHRIHHAARCRLRSRFA